MTQQELIAHFKGRRPAVLIVLDGWGVGHGDEGDAIAQARTPTIDMLKSEYATTTLEASGPHVGLPSPKDIGGSEVGHMTMGAGRIVAMGPTRINRMIDSGEFFDSEVLNRLVDQALAHDGALHLVGLLSDGNVHSHIDHFYAVIDHAARRGVRQVYVHPLLDGRDVPFQSALDYVEPMEERLARINAAHPDWRYRIASGGGREVIVMDRDKVWRKVKRGWDVIVHGECENRVASAKEAIEAARAEKPDMVDQDLPPFVVVEDGEPVGPVRDGDAMVFMNFRGDRAIEFTQAMVQDDFDGFDRGRRPDVLYAGMAVYDEDTDMPPLRLIGPPKISAPFPKRILEQGLRQFRLAETQKYAHVTFFFNGGRREPLDPDLETYHLIPSDKVDSFAEKPEMKAREIGEKACEFIRSGRYDFGLINFANADMVGHTGDLAATITGVEAVDRALAKICEAIREVEGVALITADHGNGEEMISDNPKTHKREINTRHSLNVVPVYLFDPRHRDGGYRLRASANEHPNTLANLAATCFILLGQAPPDDIEPSLFATP